ncbi:MAG: hypothetical protein LUG64_02055 [Clostridiales bacterium]|nr:hypothetical protein [Clostridiales bacterium]
MRHAVKINNSSVLAYELGADSPMEQTLIQNGVIIRHPDNDYELFSLEAVNGTGERALPGDYFKCELIDGRYYAYPIQRDYFLSTHTHLSGNEYQQKNLPLAVWTVKDPSCPEMDYLLSNHLITIDEQNAEKYFNAHLFGTALSAPITAIVAFYRIDRTPDGSIQRIAFNFIEEKYFEKNYRYC